MDLAASRETQGARCHESLHWSLTVRAVLLAAFLLCASLPSPSSAVRTSPPSRSSVCGAPLSRERILDILLDLLRVPSEKDLLEDYELSINYRDCRNAVLLSLREPFAVEPLYFEIDDSGRIVNPPTCWWLGDRANCSFEFQGDTLTLGPLRLNCRIQKAWVGGDHLPWGAWISCDGRDPHPLTHPLGLLGLVRIENPDAALAVLRFFSSPSTAQLFPLGGMLDIAMAEGPWQDKVIPLLPHVGSFMSRK